MSKQGSIYCATCVKSGLRYVGQTRDTKTKAGREYAYGVMGRWNDHLSCPATTPLGRAISEHGASAFKVETLEAGVSEERLDEREAHWIATLNTCVPNGYNKMRHGRCRHRADTSLAEFYAPRTTGVRLRQIRRDGVPHLIYAYLSLVDGSEARIVFGQGAGSSYATAVADATKFLSAFTAPIDADPRVLSAAATEYDAKLSRFDGLNVQRIRVAKFNSLAAVYVDKERICFGGKHSTYDESVEKALTFASLLQQKYPTATLIDNASKSATGGCPPS